MNYQDQTLQNALAAEYVLGTLTGAARRRFDKLLQDDAELRAAVHQWEQKLAPLHEAVPPRRPPAQVWQVIQRRLGLARESQTSRGWWHSLALWRTLASTATLALVLVVSLQWLNPVPGNEYLVVIQNSDKQASWLAKADPVSKQLLVQVVNPQTLAANKSFELWMLPAGDAAPVSLGLISATDDSRLILSETMLTALASAQGLAVSLEPAGGSPTGAPTGPVLYSGAIKLI